MDGHVRSLRVQMLDSPRPSLNIASDWSRINLSSGDRSFGRRQSPTLKPVLIRYQFITWYEYIN